MTRAGTHSIYPTYLHLRLDCSLHTRSTGRQYVRSPRRSRPSSLAMGRGAWTSWRRSEGGTSRIWQTLRSLSSGRKECVNHERGWCNLNPYPQPWDPYYIPPVPQGPERIDNRSGPLLCAHENGGASSLRSPEPGCCLPQLETGRADRRRGRPQCFTCLCLTAGFSMNIVFFRSLSAAVADRQWGCQTPILYRGSANASSKKSAAKKKSWQGSMFSGAHNTAKSNGDGRRGTDGRGEAIRNGCH
jgi:hypothetical protein